jgi:hypothetical protein
MNARSSGTIDVGVSKIGPGPSGSIVVVPSVAKNVAICLRVEGVGRHKRRRSDCFDVRQDVWGFFGTNAGLAANARSLR